MSTSQSLVGRMSVMSLVEIELALKVAKRAYERESPLEPLLIPSELKHLSPLDWEIVGNLLGRLNGKLSEADKQYVEQAFRLYQNQLLHGPISALGEAGTPWRLLAGPWAHADPATAIPGPRTSSGTRRPGSYMNRLS